MKNLIGIAFLSFLLSACSTKKMTINSVESTRCLNLLDPFNYDCIKFTPKWISNNKIERIIERKYSFEKNKKLHFVSIIDFNADGYPLTKYTGLAYPENDAANKKEISSKSVYSYETQDSFVVSKVTKIDFRSINNDKMDTDTSTQRNLFINSDKSKRYKNLKNELVFTYQYDSQNRLEKIKDSAGESLCTLKYLSAENIEMEKWSFTKGYDYSSTISINKQNQFDNYYDGSNKTSYEFKYNKLGQLIEEKSQSQNNDKTLQTYEYIILR